MKARRAASVQHGNDAPHRNGEAVRHQAGTEPLDEGIRDPAQQIRQVTLVVEGVGFDSISNNLIGADRSIDI
jgi:hypothetical protein